GSPQRSAQQFADAEEILAAPAAHEQAVGILRMTIVADETTVEPMQRPARAAQPRREVEFRVCVEVAVGQVADLFDRGTTVEAAAIHAVDGAEMPLHPLAADTAREFEVRHRQFLDVAGD